MIGFCDPTLKISPDVSVDSIRLVERPDRVLHVAEAARLRAVAVDLERLAASAPATKRGITMPYWPRLARARRC